MPDYQLVNNSQMLISGRLDRFRVEKMPSNLLTGSEIARSMV